jgi:hypothetical protein
VDLQDRLPAEELKPPSSFAPAVRLTRMSTPPASKATRREWIGLAVIALPCLLYSMDLTGKNGVKMV